MATSSDPIVLYHMMQHYKDSLQAVQSRLDELTVLHFKALDQIDGQDVRLNELARIIINQEDDFNHLASAYEELQAQRDQALSSVAPRVRRQLLPFFDDVEV